MALPTATYAEWLRAESLWVTAEDAALAAAWGDDAPKAERLTGLATKVGADDEAVRQLAFMGQAMAREVHQLVGRFTPLIGKTITLICERLGYDAGLNVIVLGAVDNLATGMSAVTVLRRL